MSYCLGIGMPHGTRKNVPFVEKERVNFEVRINHKGASVKVWIGPFLLRKECPKGMLGGSGSILRLLK